MIISLTAIGIVIIMTIFHALGWLAPVESGVLRVMSPAKRFIFSVGNSTFHFSKSIQNLKYLYQDNEHLKTENNRLKAQVNTFTEIKKENEELREQLSLLPKDPYELIGAHIIGYDPDKTKQIRIINRGEDDNVHINDAVIISEGLLVGKVIETHSRTSKIMLLEGDQSVINIKIAQKDITGIVRGEHGTGLLLDLVPQQETIETDDQILTSGLGKDYPKDLTVGTINEIRKSDSDIFQQAYVEPSVKTRNVKHVFVITNTESLE